MRLRRALLGMLIVAGAFTGLALAVLTLPTFGGRVTGARLLRVRANPRYQDGKFVNVVPPAGYSFAEMKLMFTEQFFGTQQRIPATPIPVLPVIAESLAASPSDSTLRAFWIGHSTAYIEIDGTRLLTDPIF